jgi:hypothetical protein
LVASARKLGIRIVIFIGSYTISRKENWKTGKEAIIAQSPSEAEVIVLINKIEE